MENNHKKTSTTPRESLNRRQVLAGIGKFTAVALAKQLTPPLIYEIVSQHNIVDIPLSQKIQALEKKAQQNGAEINPTYRAVLDTIKLACTLSKQNGIQPFFNYSPEYVKDENIRKRLMQVPGFDYMKHLKNEIPPITRLVLYRRMDLPAASFSDLAIPGGGIAQRIYNEKGIRWDQMDSHAQSSILGDFYHPHEERIAPVVKAYLFEIKDFVDAMVERTKKPISAAHILTHILQNNKGDMGQSLLDLSSFLKWTSRCEWDTARPFKESKAIVQWFSTHILDEYGRIGSYRNLPEENLENDYNRNLDKSAINLIGKPYHVWSLAALSMYLSPTIIQYGVISREETNYSAQGNVKLAADFHGARELPDIDAYLKTLSRIK